MHLKTLDDVLAWATTLHQAGVTTLDNAELQQALLILAANTNAHTARLAECEERNAALQATNAAQDARLAAHEERIATLVALLDEERDDAYRAAYEYGYHTGWAHALEAIDD
jgi:hypothetical protein